MEKIGRSIPVTRPYKLPFESNKWGSTTYYGPYIKYIDAGNAVSLNVSSVSIFIWKTPANAGPGFNYKNTSVQKQQSITSVNPYWLYGGRPGESIVLERRDAGAVYHSISSNKNNWAQNVLYNIVAQENSLTNLWEIYVNGILDNTQVDAFVPANSTGNLLIGGQGFSSRDFNNNIFEVAIFGQTLTQPQIQDLMYGRTLPTQFDCRLWHDYRLGHARDLSGNGNHGTLNGNVRFV